jgi:uncharacterized protein involved in exopolysaccharide biosynthesis
LVLPLAGAVTATAIVLRRPKLYAAAAAFIPQTSSSGRSRLAGLAAQFGVSVGDADSRQSPAFYAELLKSHALLKQLVETPLPAESLPPRAATLIDYWGGTGSLAERRERAIAHTRSNLSVQSGRETAIVSFSFLGPTPLLARSGAERVLQLVNEFDARSRREQAAAERSFVQERLDEARGDLRRAEQLLANFDRQNRVVDYSPDLQLERERLMREVTLQQQLFASLAQGFAQSRIDALRNTPSIAVVDSPDTPVGPEPRRLPAMVLVGLIVGLLASIVLMAVREMLHAVRTQRTPDAAPAAR